MTTRQKPHFSLDTTPRINKVSASVSYPILSTENRIMKTRAWTRTSGSVSANDFTSLMALGAYTGNVGGLVNYLLDQASDDKIIIVNQVTGVVTQLAAGDAAAVATMIADVTPELVIDDADVSVSVTPSAFE